MQNLKNTLDLTKVRRNIINDILEADKSISLSNDGVSNENHTTTGSTSNKLAIEKDGSVGVEKDKSRANV